MRVLYIGANLRMQSSTYTAPKIRALGLKQGLEQTGVEIVSLMGGDQVDTKGARTIYQKRLKRSLSRGITNALRDVYEIVYDQRFYRVVKLRVGDINPDIILQKHSRYAQVGIKLGRKYDIPVFLDDITPVWEGEQYSGRSLRPVASLLRKKAFSQAAGLIAVSRDMEVRLQSEGIPSHRIHFVPNGVDCTLFNPDTTSVAMRQRYGFTNKIVVGYVGGFALWHRLDFLVRAAFSVAKAMPDIHFLLVGDDLDGQIENMAREQGLVDRFTFAGGVPHSEVPLYLNAMDIAVLPSTLSYMSPIKIYEYMAMRKPVIAPDGNSITEEVIIPYKNGLLFEAGNEDALCHAIMTLATNPELRQKMGVEAREFVQSNCTWYHQADKLLRAFRAAG
jgi:glycosyltransferase involved in cell wall biosynthesis